jgi:hypothetical protein
LRTTFDTAFQLSEIAAFAYLDDFLFRVRRFFGAATAAAAAAAAAASAASGIVRVTATAAACGNAGIDVPSLGDDVVKVIVFRAFTLLGLARHGFQMCELRGKGDVPQQ